MVEDDERAVALLEDSLPHQTPELAVYALACGADDVREIFLRNPWVDDDLLRCHRRIVSPRNPQNRLRDPAAHGIHGVEFDRFIVGACAPAQEGNDLERRLGMLGRRGTHGISVYDDGSGVAARGDVVGRRQSVEHRQNARRLSRPQKRIEEPSSVLPRFGKKKGPFDDDPNRIDSIACGTQPFAVAVDFDFGVRANYVDGPLWPARHDARTLQRRTNLCALIPHETASPDSPAPIHTITSMTMAEALHAPVCKRLHALIQIVQHVSPTRRSTASREFG